VLMLPFGIAEVAVVAPCEAVVMVEVVVVTAVDMATIARYSAKCVVRRATLLSVVIRGSMQITVGKRSMQMQPLPGIAWTPSGTRTLVPQIILPRS
jgi:hypothetical protein